MRKQSAKRNHRDYEVGFGRPPKANQFKPGKSGNPRGRPKGTRPVGAVLQEVLRQRIPVTENGRTRRLPALEVMIRRLANEAMRSEPSAIKLILSLVDRYTETAEATLSIDEVLAEDRAIIERYLPSSPAKQNLSKPQRRRKRYED
jgi:Family of unknown function (DUF5681)